MNQENKILSTLPSNARKGLEDFSRGLQQTFGDGLVAVLLYGSAALGEYIPGRSDLNVLVVLDDVNLGRLRHAARIVQQAQRKHNIEPRFMSLDEIRRGADVLPITFLDIQENYTVLYGQDVLGDLTISSENLRLQCENQMRAILLRMRHRYLYSIRDRKRLRTILDESFTKFLHIIKAFYRLDGETPPARKADIISGASERFGLDRDVLTSLLALKLGTRKFSREKLEELFEGYLSVVKAAAVRVDRMAAG